MILLLGKFYNLYLKFLLEYSKQFENFPDLEKNLNSTVVYNQDVLEAFTSLVEYGPNVTKSVVMAFIEPANLLVKLPLVQLFLLFHYSKPTGSIISAMALNCPLVSASILPIHFRCFRQLSTTLLITPPCVRRSWR